MGSNSNDLAVEPLIKPLQCSGTRAFKTKFYNVSMGSNSLQCSGTRAQA